MQDYSIGSSTGPTITGPRGSFSGGPVIPKKPGKPSLRIIVILLIIFLLIFAFGGAILLKKQTSKVSNLRSAQIELQSELDRTHISNFSKLEDLTASIVELRTQIDKELPKEVEQQYSLLLSKLEKLSKSSDSKISSTANKLMLSLKSQSGEGISLSGENNSVISNEGVLSLNGSSGRVQIQGVPNQVSVSQNGNTTTVGTVQDIGANSSPIFNNQTLTGDSLVQGSMEVQGTTTTGELNIQNTGTQNGYTLCDSSNNCGYSGAGSSFVQGGNSFGNQANLGTNDNNELNLKTNGITRLNLDTFGNANFSGGINTTGSVSASSFTGDGTNVSNVDATKLGGQNASYYLNASNISNGTLSDGRLSTNVTLQGNSFNGANQLVQLTSGGILPILDGSQLTNVIAANSIQLGGHGMAYYLNASNLSSGTLSDTLLSGNVTLQGNTFNGPNQLVKLGGGGLLPVLNGANLTNVDAQTLNGQLAAYYLNAGNINGGTLSDARLSSNVALKNATNTFTGINNFAGLTATGVLQNGFSVCDASNNCNYATSGQFSNAVLQGGNSFGTSISIGTGDNNDFNLASNGTSRLQISSAGDITQFGTLGNITLDRNGNLINFSRNHINYFQAGSAGGSFEFRTNGAFPRLTISYGGNIGIGTTSPGEKLQVAGNGLFSGSITGASLFQGVNSVCDTSNNCNFASSSGSANYIQNGISPQTANINILSAAANKVGLAIQGAVGQTSNLQEWRNNVGSTISSVDSDGSIKIGTNTRRATTLSVGIDSLTGYGGVPFSIVDNYYGYSIGGLGPSNINNWPNNNYWGVYRTSSNTFYQNSSGSHIFFSSNTNFGGIVSRGSSGQTYDLLQIQNSSSSVMARITSTGQIFQGSNQVCDTSNNCNYANSSGSVDYVQNSTTLQTADLNISGGAKVNNLTLQNGGEISSSLYMSINSQGSGNGNLAVSSASNRTVYLGYGTNNAIQFGMSGNNGIWRANGNLNIGTTTADLGQLGVVNKSAAKSALVIQGAAGQTANLQEWQNSSGTMLAGVDKNGNFTVQSEVISSKGALVLRGANGLVDAGDYLSMSGNGRISALGAQVIEWNTTTGTVKVGAHGGTYETVYVGHGGSATKKGNVMIGNNGSANGRLHVKGSNFYPSETTGILQGAVGQTGDLLQAQDSTGAVLAKIDSGGNLSVKNANVEGAYISFSNNIRGYNVSVPTTTASQVVIFSTAHSDNNYAVFCTPDWNTTCYVTNKTTTGFTLNFGSPAPASQKIDWFVTR